MLEVAKDIHADVLNSPGGHCKEPKSQMKLLGYIAAQKLVESSQFKAKFRNMEWVRPREMGHY